MWTIKNWIIKKSRLIIKFVYAVSVKNTFLIIMRIKIFMIFTEHVRNNTSLNFETFSLKVVVYIIYIVKSCINKELYSKLFKLLVYFYNNEKLARITATFLNKTHWMSTN